MTDWLDSPISKAVSLLSAVLGIIAFFQIKKAIVKNRVDKSKIGGSFVGRKGKSSDNLQVENQIKNTEIKGDFTGSDES